MSHTIKNSSATQQNDEASVLLKFFAETFTKMSEQAGESLKLKNLGLDTALTQRVKDAISIGPIGNLLQFGLKVNSDVEKALSMLVAEHLSQYEDQIDIAKLETENLLHFYISLKEDSSSNRSQLNSFFDDYYCSPYSAQFPVIFTYTNSTRLNKIDGLQTIDFSE